MEKEPSQFQSVTRIIINETLGRVLGRLQPIWGSERECCVLACVWKMFERVLVE